MDNYYNELSQLELLKQELDKFSYSLENNKAGCFKHRIEAIVNILLNETRNQNYLRNNIQNYIKEANYSDDVKSYVMQVFLSFFEPIEFNIPKSLINVVNRNERFDSAMIEGYSNFKSVNNYTQSQEPHKEALQPQQTEKPKPESKEIELSKMINKHFKFFSENCPRKHKQILNDTDFKKLIEWTIWYFVNEFKVPEISEPIKVVNTNKTFVQLAFKYLFKKLHKSSPYPETLFEFYQSAFAPYSEDKKSNFEAVRNNDEVKKLMQIDY